MIFFFFSFDGLPLSPIFLRLVYIRECEHVVLNIFVHSFISIFLLFRSADGVPLDGVMPLASTAHFSSSGVPGVVIQSCVAALSNHESSSSSIDTTTSSTPSSTASGSSTTTSSSKKQSRDSSRTPPHNMDWPRPGSALLRLNHYMYRSRDFALRVKACRALPAAGKVLMIRNKAHVSRDRCILVSCL